MFIAESRDERVLAVKPMNCPGHVLIFRNRLRSYRELPLRLAEFGSCHRNEPSGALHGIMRVRAFTQDDAHIFCTEDQVTPEAIAFCELLLSIYRDFGFDEVAVKFADRPAHARRQRRRLGPSPSATWKKRSKRPVSPTRSTPAKARFTGRSSNSCCAMRSGRDWQCGTLQLDFVMPERLGAAYVGEDGARHRAGHAAPRDPRLVRALYRHPDRALRRQFPALAGPGAGRRRLDHRRRGRLRRGGRRPSCARAGLRVATDTGGEKIGYKVREHSLAKIPVILAVGRREAERRGVSLRRLGSTAQEALALDELIARLKDEASPPG